MPPSIWRSFARSIVDAAGAQPVQPQPSQADAGTDSPSPEELFLDAALKQLEVQISTNDVLDSRNTSLLATATSILPVTIGLLALSEAELSRELSHDLWGLSGRLWGADPTFLVFVPPVIFYVVLLFVSWRASVFRGLEFRPRLSKLEEYTAEYAGESLRQWIANEYVASTQQNGRVLGRKARWVGAANTFAVRRGVSALGSRPAFPIVSSRPWVPEGGSAFGR